MIQSFHSLWHRRQVTAAVTSHPHIHANSSLCLSLPHSVAGSCSVLQCGAVRCNTPCIARSLAACLDVPHSNVHDDDMPHSNVHDDDMPHSYVDHYVCRDISPWCVCVCVCVCVEVHVMYHRNILQQSATLCNTLQHSATHYNTLKLTATDYKTSCVFVMQHVLCLCDTTRPVSL